MERKKKLIVFPGGFLKNFKMQLFQESGTKKADPVTGQPVCFFLKL
jgi:hypothetical protein